MHADILGVLPAGRTLPDAEWERRHRAMLWFLWAHTTGLLIFSLARGWSVESSLASIVPIVAAGLAATVPGASRRARSVAMALGLLTCSAMLVHAWDGQIEAHFDFFVMIAVLALYEDWLPFGVAVAYVVVEHGVVGVLAPHAVYSHGGNPWMWAGIHGGFVAAAGAAAVMNWRLNEDTRRSMREVHERFQRAFESGVTGMTVCDPAGHFVSVNRALCEMLGYDEAELVGRYSADFLRPEDIATCAEQNARVLSGEIDVYEVEVGYVHRDGHDVWAQVGVSTIRGDDGAVRWFVTQAHDVSERRRFADELAHRALHDALTGLPNRTLFLDRLRQALVRRRRHGGEVAVLFVDLDRFKRLNDELGHLAGDTALREAAQRLAGAARAEDTVARFGGDEFTILCDGVDAGEAEAIARRALAALGTPLEVEGQELRLGGSIGIRVSAPGDADPDALVRDADEALYAAKRRRGRWELFDVRHARRRTDVLGIERGLRVALDRGELCLHYQPMVDLETGALRKLEALVRWEHPVRGLLAPGAFIPVAEETGLIADLGEWVLGEACRRLAAWRRARVAPPELQVAVNVSARQLSGPELPDVVATALEATGLPPEALCIEITESAVIQDGEVAVANLLALRARGVSIALDDFGVGFSSLSQIRELPPVDVIKIDRSFVSGLGGAGSDTAVVEAVLGLARSLGLRAVAEGVETEEQAARLRELGCDLAQGYLFARPAPAAEVEQALLALAAAA